METERFLKKTAYLNEDADGEYLVVSVRMGLFRLTVKCYIPDDGVAQSNALVTWGLQREHEDEPKRFPARPRFTREPPKQSEPDSDSND